MKRWKIHIPPVPKVHFMGELKSVLFGGVTTSDAAEHCACPEEADFILLDFRHLLHDYYRITRPEKTIMVDYRDQQTHVFPAPLCLYFKRSVVRHRRDGLEDYKRRVIPIGYCVKEPYRQAASQAPVKRDICVAICSGFCNSSIMRWAYPCALLGWVT